MMIHSTKLITLLILICLMYGTHSYDDTETSCIWKDGKLYNCLKISECPVWYKKIGKPLSQGTLQELRRHNCGFDGREPKVYCPCNEHKNLHLLNQHMCGEYYMSKIIGGEVAELNEFPWMALLSYRLGKRRKFMCGGSLINNKYVLTAAHCIDSTLDGVRIGEYNIRKKNDCVSYLGEEECADEVQDFEIETTIVHENFNGTTFSADIALIRLDGIVDMTKKNARPVCLPTSPDMKMLNLTDFNMAVTGWGITENGTRSDVLRKVLIPVVNNKNCNTKPKYSKFITPNHICAGSPGRDSCNGDSGGPLISPQLVEKRLAYIQFGIVSFGSKKCGGSEHGVYTRVTEYMDWILEHLQP